MCCDMCGKACEYDSIERVAVFYLTPGDRRVGQGMIHDRESVIYSPRWLLTPAIGSVSQFWRQLLPWLAPRLVLQGRPYSRPLARNRKFAMAHLWAFQRSCDHDYEACMGWKLIFLSGGGTVRANARQFLPVFLWFLVVYITPDGLRG